MKTGEKNRGELREREEKQANNCINALIEYTRWMRRKRDSNSTSTPAHLNIGKNKPTTAK